MGMKPRLCKKARELRAWAADKLTAYTYRDYGRDSFAHMSNSNNAEEGYMQALREVVQRLS